MRKKSKRQYRLLIAIMTFIMSINFVAGLQGVSAEQITPNIELENLEQGQIVSGQLEIEGWSINPTGIKEVNIYVEEQIVGQAEIGISTPEIKEKYPDVIDSDQSGFTYSLDTTTLENGVNKLIIESVGNDGKIDNLQIDIDVQNLQVKEEVKEETKVTTTLMMSTNDVISTQSVLEPKMYIDTPINNQKISTKEILVQGWALNAKGIKEVNVLVDGVKVGSATIGKSRPDVNKAYPGYIGGDTSGYEYILDTSKIKSGGLITVQAVGTDGTTQTSSVTINKPVAIMSIDEPTNNKTMSTKEILIRGWAVNGSGIKEVNILVDGVKVGSATIGKARPDVNKAFPGYIGGDTSGYEYILDTSKVKSGGLITVQAVGTDGTTQTSSVTINKKESLMTIDEPINNKTMSTKEILIRGWAINGSGIKEVNILVDGVKVGSATRGKSRADVNKAYPGYIGGDTSGYEYILDTSKIKSGGLITVQAVGTDGTAQTSSVTINKPVAIMSIDEPTNNKIISTKEILIRGWAVNGSGIKEVNILVDGVKIGSATIGKVRADVNKAYPGYIGGDTSGYEYILDTSKVKPGGLITVQAVGTDGTNQASSITVTKASPYMSIDEPKNNESISKQEVLVRGWAVNGSGIKEVNILVNGVKVGSATIGKSRPDVNKAFPGYGDNNGYEYTLNINTVKPGSLITVQAVGTDGTSQSSSVNITKPAAKMFVDTPANNQVVNKEEVLIKGWALNSSGVKEVNILVNGQKVGSATIGLSRPDVNSAHPGYKDGANSGFEYTLNIRDMGIGEQVVTVQAVGNDGTSTSEVRNIISNYSATTQYNSTLDQIVAKQVAVSPQTDYYGNGWQVASAEDVRYFVNPDNFTQNTLPAITVNATTLNVRTLPSTAGTILTTVTQGKTYTVMEKSKGWYKIITSNRIGWVSGDYVTETTVVNDLMYQFLDLSKVAGISEKDLSSILSDKGDLKNYASTFIAASKQYSVNEIYLVSHALLETGNGKSYWVTGIRVDANGDLINDSNYLVNSAGTVTGGLGKTPYTTVYNMFGIGALDSNPKALGAKRAFTEGWTSVEKAIVGGTKFVSESYINNATYKQNTLYKMRWNPAKPATHQYATDIAWAVKQVPRIKQLYDLCSEYVLHFDVPEYLD